MEKVLGQKKKKKEDGDRLRGRGREKRINYWQIYQTKEHLENKRDRRQDEVDQEVEVVNKTTPPTGD